MVSIIVICVRKATTTASSTSNSSGCLIRDDYRLLNVFRRSAPAACAISLRRLAAASSA
jgi:hypothetical protein